MGCNCGGGAVRQWIPANQRQPEASAADDQLSPNDRIQQQRREQAARRVWPKTWQGREHTPA